MCYISRINEQEFKGEFDKEFTEWTKQTCQSPFQPEEDDFVEGQNDTGLTAQTQEYTGYAAITGHWMVHLFEAENPLMNKFINRLHEKLT